MQFIQRIIMYAALAFVSTNAIAQNFGTQPVIGGSFSAIKTTSTAFNFYDRVLDNKVFALYSHNNMARFWHNDNGDVFQLTSDGRVGIGPGAGAPLARLHLRGDENGHQYSIIAPGRIQMISPQAGIFFTLSGGIHKYFFGNANNNGLGMYSSATLKWHLLMKDNGAIIIAPDAVSVQPPSDYRLVVKGRAIAEEVRVLNSSNWPDYVFADDYPLLPLAELDQYIKTHNHLPNLPQATEIEKEGFDLGEMQKKLLEKVEELTLYTIQLHQENQSLRTELSDLKSKAKTKKRRRA